MCAKLRTVAATNNRVHPTRSLYYSLFALHIYGVVLRTHAVLGERRIQRKASGEVATTHTRVKINVSPTLSVCFSETI